MTRAGLDYKNPVGVEARIQWVWKRTRFSRICIIEWNLSEGLQESERIASARPRSQRSLKSPKPKPESAHKVGEISGKNLRRRLTLEPLQRSLVLKREIFLSTDKPPT